MPDKAHYEINERPNKTDGPVTYTNWEKVKEFSEKLFSGSSQS